MIRWWFVGDDLVATNAVWQEDWQWFMMMILTFSIVMVDHRSGWLYMSAAHASLMSDVQLTLGMRHGNLSDEPAELWIDCGQGSPLHEAFPIVGLERQQQPCVKQQLLRMFCMKVISCWILWLLDISLINIAELFRSVSNSAKCHVFLIDPWFFQFLISIIALSKTRPRIIQTSQSENTQDEAEEKMNREQIREHIVASQSGPNISLSWRHQRNIRSHTSHGCPMALASGVLPSGVLRPPVAVGPLLDDEPELHGRSSW